MIGAVNISNFMQWFLGEFVRIAQFLVNWLDNIELVNGVSLLNFIVTLAIISAFISIIITLPQTANRISAKESKSKAKKESKK